MQTASMTLSGSPLQSLSRSEEQSRDPVGMQAIGPASAGVQTLASAAHAAPSGASADALVAGAIPPTAGGPSATEPPDIADSLPGTSGVDAASSGVTPMEPAAPMESGGASANGRLLPEHAVAKAKTAILLAR